MGFELVTKRPHGAHLGTERGKITVATSKYKNIVRLTIRIVDSVMLEAGWKGNYVAIEVDYEKQLVRLRQVEKQSEAAIKLCPIKPGRSSKLTVTVLEGRPTVDKRTKVGVYNIDQHGNLIFKCEGIYKFGAARTNDHARRVLMEDKGW